MSTFEPKTDKAAEYARLAGLPLDEYDREREAVAETLGIRVSTLDTIVQQRRKGTVSDHQQVPAIIVGVLGNAIDQRVAGSRPVGR